MIGAPNRHGRAIRPLGVLAIAALVLTACAKSGPSTSGTGGSSKELIGTRTIAGIGTVLDTAAGFTLYHLTKETGGTIQCTGSCATTWPPLLAPAGAPPSMQDLGGTIGTIRRPDGGTQLTFDGQPLYRYAGDASPGQANGQGIGGVWFAVTTSATGGSHPSPPGY